MKRQASQRNQQQQRDKGENADANKKSRNDTYVTESPILNGSPPKRLANGYSKFSVVDKARKDVVPSSSTAHHVIAPTVSDAFVLFLKRHSTNPSSVGELKRPALRVSGQVTVDVLAAYLDDVLALEGTRKHVIFFCSGIQVGGACTVKVLSNEILEGKAEYLELEYLVADREVELDAG